MGGIAVGASSVVGPMYISEIAPARLRGRLAGSFQLNIVTGIFVALLTNFLFMNIGDNSWRWMLGIMIVPAVVFRILLYFIPESPRWLILNDREAEAIPIMQKIGEPNFQQAITDIRASVTHHTENLFPEKIHQTHSVRGFAGNAFNQLSGINALFYYAPRIFEMAGFDKSHSYLQPVYIGAANLVFTLLAMSMIDRFGRKTLLLIGSVGMILFLALTGSSLAHISDDNGKLIFYLIGFIAFFAFSQGAVVWVFISEIFPNSVRSKGGSLGSFTHWIMAALISWVFPSIASITTKNTATGVDIHTGVVNAFYFFSIMMAIHFFFVWKVMPETKGRSLETIQKEMGID